jgi:hypothetical protein
MEDTPEKSSSLWSLPLLCLGLGILAIVILIPQAEANKKLTADRDQLKADLAQVESQLSVNQEFLADVNTDPELAERLAQRQMRQIRAGTTVLDLKGIDNPQNVSPFQMISIPHSEPVIPYHPLTGLLGDICRDAHQQLYAIGIGMFMIACALVLGVSSEPKSNSNFVIRH